MESINSWSQRAKCRNRNLDIFDIKNKKFCTGCPVASLCRTYAIVHLERGVWGGTSDNERRSLDPYMVDILRKLYRNANLLEDRPGLLANQELVEVQQRGQIDPISSQEVLKDPKSNQSLSEH